MPKVTKKKATKATPGAGKGSVATGTQEAEVKPHEFLLKIAAGAPVRVTQSNIVRYKKGAKAGQIMKTEIVEFDHYPTFSERVDAAKAAAPYFAPRLAAQMLNLKPGANVEEMMKKIAEGMPV